MAKKTHTSKQTKNPIKEAKEKEKKKKMRYIQRSNKRTVDFSTGTMEARGQ